MQASTAAPHAAPAASQTLSGEEPVTDLRAPSEVVRQYEREHRVHLELVEVLLGIDDLGVEVGREGGAVPRVRGRERDRRMPDRHAQVEQELDPPAFPRRGSEPEAEI